MSNKIKINDKVSVLGTYGWVDKIEEINGETRVTIDLVNGGRYATSLDELIKKIDKGRL